MNKVCQMIEKEFGIKLVLSEKNDDENEYIVFTENMKHQIGTLLIYQTQRKNKLCYKVGSKSGLFLDPNASSDLDAILKTFDEPIEKIDLINIKKLKKLHEAGGILHTEPTSWIRFDIPEEVLSAYKTFIDAKKHFANVLLKYDINL